MLCSKILPSFSLICRDAQRYRQFLGLNKEDQNIEESEGSLKGRNDPVRTSLAPTSDQEAEDISDSRRQGTPADRQVQAWLGWGCCGRPAGCCFLIEVPMSLRQHFGKQHGCCTAASSCSCLYGMVWTGLDPPHRCVAASPNSLGFPCSVLDYSDKAEADMEQRKGSVGTIDKEQYRSAGPNISLSAKQDELERQGFANNPTRA